MQPVACRSCGTRVLVEKYSAVHTSVQWTSAAGRSCAEFAAADTNSAFIRTCLALRDSIDHAVATGAVEVTTREVP